MLQLGSNNPSMSCASSFRSSIGGSIRTIQALEDRVKEEVVNEPHKEAETCTQTTQH